MTTGESYIDVDSAQRSKAGQFVAGDVFVCRKIKEESRVIAVLSDGLGSGVKASVLANLTATMAMKYTAAFEDIRKSAATIMETLPVCEIRKISYSTFTIIDLEEDGVCRLVEHGNPPVILMRNAQPLEFARESFHLDAWKDREICYGQIKLEVGDRLICLSDGVTQAGMGKPAYPLGWGSSGVMQELTERIGVEPEISAAELSRVLVEAACGKDEGKARDDVTAAVVYFRHPRWLLIVTGAPFHRERDRALAETAASYAGRKVIAGGTTATIIARELKRPVKVDIADLHADVPPRSTMEGFDLVTEGTLTLAKAAELLEQGQSLTTGGPSAAHVLARMMIESDIVEFLVGTRINDAHQDPNIPIELDLRRNIVRRLASHLEQHYHKKTTIRFT